MKYLLLTLFVFAQTPKHREHSAHAHGSGKLGIAFDNNKGSVDFHIPAESIIGFEHTAKKEKDKKTKADQLSLLENKISEMLVFEKSLNCQISKEKVEVSSEGEHSDVQANFNIICEKSPKGTSVVFNFQKYFKKIKDLDVQILVDDLQKSFEANKTGSSILLKK